MRTATRSPRWRGRWGRLAQRHGRGARSRPAPGRPPVRLAAPTTLAIDEHSFLSGAVEHPTPLVTGFVDLDRHRLLDVVEGRTAQGVSGWLSARPAPWLAAIRTVTLDPYAGYAKPRRRTPARRAGRRTLPRRAWPTPPWTRSAAGSSGRRSVTAAATANRCTGSDASYSSPTSDSPSAGGPHPSRARSWRSRRGRRRRLPRQGTPARGCTPPPRRGRLVGGSSASTRTAAPPRSSSSALSPAPSAGGSTRSWAGAAPACPTDPAKP